MLPLAYFCVKNSIFFRELQQNMLSSIGNIFAFFIMFMFTSLPLEKLPLQPESFI